jgi:hypothetical protein
MLDKKRDFMKTMYRTFSISTNVVLAFVVLVPLACDQQGVLGQVSNISSPCGELKYFTF